MTGSEQYGGLWHDVPALFDVVLTNPPFGGKEGTDAQTNFSYKTGATQVLFLQHVIDSLTPNGSCGMVVDEGVLFRTNEKAFVQTKRKLLDACDLWCVVSLPNGAFTATGAGVKTNVLFFTRGKPTEKIWYYDLSELKVTKRQPLLRAHFDEFFSLLPERANSDRSWTLSREEIERRKFDLKAVNPNRKRTTDTRTPTEILARIEELRRQADNAIVQLKHLIA